MKAEDLVKNEVAYRLKGQSDILYYLGYNFSANGYWHQFRKVGVVGVWAELLESDLRLLEEWP